MTDTHTRAHMHTHTHTRAHTHTHTHTQQKSKPQLSYVIINKNFNNSHNFVMSGQIKTVTYLLQVTNWVHYTLHQQQHNSANKDVPTKSTNTTEIQHKNICMHKNYQSLGQQYNIGAIGHCKQYTIRGG